MKQYYLFLAGIFFLMAAANAQVGINSSGNPPHESAMLDVESNSRGLMVPRMTTTERDAITNPLPGLQIFNTVTNCIEFYLGSDQWFNVCDKVKCVSFRADISSTNNVSCLGGNDGQAVVTAEEGLEPYIYLWTGGGGTESTASGLAAGSYSVTVTDSNGCEATANAAIEDGVAVPNAATAGSIIPSLTQIVWNWNVVSGADGYKYNTVNNYSGATDAGTNISFTQTGLTCSTAHSLYVWAYNGCSESTVLQMNSNTSTCPFICGSNLSHGYVAGVTPNTDSQFASRTYPTVTANWSGGGGKCWTQRNIGATDQPSSSDDDVDVDRAGWYFQFNRKQGYYRTGGGPLPSWTISTINENSNWTTATDPCNVLFGTGWRVPTRSEWEAYSVTVSSSAAVFASVLNLHTAGKLTSSGELDSNRPRGRYWSSEQENTDSAYYLSFGPVFVSNAGSQPKADAAPVRCLKD